MKLLNIQSLSIQTKRQLKIGDVIHEVKPLKVSDFIRITEKAQEIANLDQNQVDHALQEIKLTVEMVRACVPTTTDEELMDLALPELQMIADFIRGVDFDEVVSVEENADTEGVEGK